MDFLNELKKTTNYTRTENGALTNKSSLNPVLDFFSLAGAMRGREKEAVTLFERAYSADNELTIRALFYLRDVRGGQGERSIFRACLTRLFEIDPEVADFVVKYIPEYGRWDDLPLSEAGIALIEEQLAKDLEAYEKGEPVSLLAKWLPSENASSTKSKTVARRLAKELELKPPQYRRTLSKLRERISLLEQRMSARAWSTIDYGKLPSQAGRKHVKAFKRHDEERYNEFLTAVEKGEKTMNASTLYTYEVFDTISRDEKAANAMWKSLPDFTNGKNALVVADVSGSMSGRPMSISVSLALYFAERNKGAFNGYFLTFSDDSRLQAVTGNSLMDKLRSIKSADWGTSTNLMSAFRAILDAAERSGAPKEEMPSTLYIISDMEFNQADGGGGYGYGRRERTNFEEAKRMFRAAGYELPHIVFWNVDARDMQAPALAGDGNVTLISGSSQSTFRYAVEGKTPEESMRDILESERYAQITL